MSDNGMKFVDFGTYCNTCKHFDKNQNQEPCNECLTEPVNFYSHKPVKYEEKK